MAATRPVAWIAEAAALLDRVAKAQTHASGTANPAWAGPPDPIVGSRLLDEADLVIDLCTPHADALVTVNGLETPVGPGSTIAAVAVVNSIKVRTAELLVERGAMPPVITRASAVGADRSRVLFDDAYREHARRIARAIGREPAGG